VEEKPRKFKILFSAKLGKECLRKGGGNLLVSGPNLRGPRPEEFEG